MRKEDLEILKSASEVLKSEFIGIDNIIDNVIEYITPWYVTPELLSRPTVISLWGMTGTGKTSLVNRLLQLLNKENVISIDCGGTTSQTNSYDNETLFDKIDDNPSDDAADADLFSGRKKVEDLVFILDEFQLFKTIDESGKELDRSSLNREIWELIDTGTVPVNSGDWEIKKFNKYIKDIKLLSEQFPNVEIENFKIKNYKDLEEILDFNGGCISTVFGVNSRYRYSDYCEDPSENTYFFDRNKNNTNEEKELATNRIISSLFLRLIRVIGKESDQSRDFCIELRNAKNLKEFYDVLKLFKKRQKIATLDCSKSLIFVIGNLDEAFYGTHSELNPDISADRLHDLTSSVTVNNIKESLLKRFRAEQVSRLGNSILIYPTLSSDSFKAIINKTVFNIFENVPEGVSFTASDNIIDLLYFEGVYPALGVRPVVSTINNILVPILSSVISKYDCGDFIISTDTDNFKRDSINIVVKNSLDQKVIFEKTIDLTLGSLRSVNGERNKESSISVKAVHEAGHALASYVCTGKSPIQVNCISVNGGGFTEIEAKKYSDILTIGELKHDLIITLAGYLAEVIFINDDNLRSLGASSDLDRAWSMISDAYYNCGLKSCAKMTDPRVSTNSSGVPTGFSENEEGSAICGNERSMSTKILRSADSGKSMNNIESFYHQAVESCIEILNRHKPVIAEISLFLMDNGTMNKEEFESVVSKHKVACNIPVSSINKRVRGMIEDVLDENEEEDD